MVKYCISCGTQNDDAAVFCTSCGQRFPSTESAPQSSPQLAAPANVTYTIELGTGAHQHMLTDLFLRDSSGTLLLVAKRPSILHRNYTIVDGTESVKGFIEGKQHLTQLEFEIMDPSRSVQGSVRRSNEQRRGMPPDCWLQDTAGNRLAALMYVNGYFGFSCSRMDGSTIFTVSMALGQGFMAMEKSLGQRKYAVELMDPTFPLMTMLAVLVAIQD
jgi:hypothetical protein